MKKLFTKEMLAKVSATTLAVVAMGIPAFALTWNSTAMNTFWQILDFMWMAFVIIGAAVVIFGAVQLGFAFKNDDADGKSKGMRAMISGAIVLAVGLAAKTLMQQMIG